MKGTFPHLLCTLFVPPGVLDVQGDVERKDPVSTEYCDITGDGENV